MSHTVGLCVGVLVSEMTHYVSSGTFNPTHSLTCAGVVGLSEASSSHHSTRLSSRSFGYGSGCRGQRADVTESR